jgi:hypothetical protein
MTFNTPRLIGVGLVVLSLLLYYACFKLSHGAVWYFILASTALIPGVLLVKYGDRGKGSHTPQRKHHFR